MGFSDLFANNVLVKWLRGETGRYDLIVSMVGVKLGERLVQVGGRDGLLLAALGGKTGLTGQVVGIEDIEAEATRVQQKAEEAGVLADAVGAPGWKTTLASETFDLAVLPQINGVTSDIDARLSEAFRLLRMGGRCTVIQKAGATASAGSTSGSGSGSVSVSGSGSGPGSGSAPATSAPIVQQIQKHGFRAARLLAERDGLAFYEGIKK